MSKKRTIETYEYPEGLSPDEKTLDKATITRTSYEVSDEELAEEEKSQRMASILAEIDELKAILANHTKRLDAGISGHKG